LNLRSKFLFVSSAGDVRFPNGVREAFGQQDGHGQVKYRQKKGGSIKGVKVAALTDNAVTFISGFPA
jgi:hypothetical protein